jgi:predicted nucleotidyltransferase
MKDAVREVLEVSPRVAYGLIFGSQARGTAHAQSDLDVAIGVAERGELVSRLESATGHAVDVVIVHETSIPVAFRIFREGTEVFIRDRKALVDQKARTIVQYLDFKPIHDRCVAGALKAAARG